MSLCTAIGQDQLTHYSAYCNYLEGAYLWVRGDWRSQMYAKYFKIKAKVCTTFKGHACNHQETFCILTNFAKLEDNAS